MPAHSRLCPLAARARDRAASFGSGPLSILLAAVLWGTTGTASRMAPAGVPAAAIGSAGLAIGGLLLCLAGGGPRALLGGLRPRDRWLLAAGSLAVAGYPLSFYPAVAGTGVAVATVIALGSAPVFAGLLGLVASGARPGARWCGATVISVLGCAALVLGPGPAGSGHAAPWGVAAAAFAGLSYAVYSFVGARLIGAGRPSGAVMGAMFGGGALIVLPVLPAGGVAWLGTVRGAAVALHLAVLTTFVAYVLFGRGLRRVSAPVATSLTLAEPAVAAVLGVTVVGERLPAVSWCGLAAIAAGLAVLALPARRRFSRNTGRADRPLSQDETNAKVGG